MWLCTEEQRKATESPGLNAYMRGKIAILNIKLRFFFSQLIRMKKNV